MSAPLNYLTAEDSLSQIQQGQLTAAVLLQTCLDRISSRETVVHAWEYLQPLSILGEQAICRDRALQQVLASDDSKDIQTFRKAHPLSGIPVAVKDIFATQEMPTAWGIGIYRGRYIEHDAAVVTRLKEASAIILGKTVTTELATAAPGPTTNPHNVAHTPGGSSSGSVAAVADGMVPLAIGSQTMGSILRPAAYCGIFGYKPSFGLISRAGMLSVCRELDHVGVFARSLADIQRLMRVLVGTDPMDSDCQIPDDFNDFDFQDNTSQSHSDKINSNCISPLNSPILGDFDLRSPQNWGAGGPGQKYLDVSEQYSNTSKLTHSFSFRLAFVKTPHWYQAETIVHTRLGEAVSVLEQAAIPVYSVTLPDVFDHYWKAVQDLCAYGLYQNHGFLLKHHSQDCSPALQQWLQRGQQISTATYEQILQYRSQCLEALAPLFKEYDAFLTPVTLGPAPQGLEQTGSPIFCGLWTFCGLPALNIPLGKTKEGLPLGCQLVGARYQDQKLLEIAKHCWPFLKKQFGDIEIPS